MWAKPEQFNLILPDHITLVYEDPKEHPLFFSYRHRTPDWRDSVYRIRLRDSGPLRRVRRYWAGPHKGIYFFVYNERKIRLDQHSLNVLSAWAVPTPGTVEIETEE